MNNDDTWLVMFIIICIGLGMYYTTPEQRAAIATKQADAEAAQFAQKLEEAHQKRVSRKASLEWDLKEMTQNPENYYSLIHQFFYPELTRAQSDEIVKPWLEWRIQDTKDELATYNDI